MTFSHFGWVSRKLWRFLIIHAILYEDETVLTFKYMDSSKILTLKDIESSDLFGDALPHNNIFAA